MNAIRRVVTCAAALALGLSLAACDKESCSENPMAAGCPTPPPPPPPPPVTRVLDAGQGQLPARVALLRPLTTNEAGSFEMIVDWTFAANDIDVFLMRGTCTFAQLIADQCVVAASGTSVGTKQERFRLANQAAGTYTLVVANFGPGDESVAYQVLFTTGTSSSASSAERSSARSVKGFDLRRIVTGLE